MRMTIVATLERKIARNNWDTIAALGGIIEDRL
jgi:hypothetical protein